MIARMTVSILFLFLGVVCDASTKFPYYIGVGRYDITGPAAQTNMVGNSFIFDFSSTDKTT